MRICGKALPPRAALLLTADMCILSVALPLLLISPEFVLPHRLAPEHSLAVLLRLVLVGIACQIVFYYNELYNLQVIRKRSELVLHLLQGMGMAMVLLAAIFALAPSAAPGLERLLAFALIAAPIAYLARRYALPKAKESVLVVGGGAQAGELMEVIVSCPEWNMEVCEIIDTGKLLPAASTDDLDLADCPAFDRVIVYPDHARDSGLLQTLLAWKLRGMNVEDATNFYERATGRVRVAYLNPEWFVYSSGFENGRRKRAVKRALDLLAAALLALLTLPVMALVAATILFEGKGPVLFSQDRIGLHGRRFRIHKFRTMTPPSAQQGEAWVTQDAKRITRLGATLRRYRLDELPQLWNIFNGSMSIVGPRPEQPNLCDMLAEHIPFYHQRHTVPPGLTGWAQVRYHYGASIEESQRKLEFDLFYVKHLSFWLDLAVLLETVKVVVVGRGAK